MAKPTFEKDIFADVPISHWARFQINYAYERGMVKGVAATQFAPDTEVTGPQFYTMILRNLMENPDISPKEVALHYAEYTGTSETEAQEMIAKSPFSRGDMVSAVYSLIDPAKKYDYIVKDGRIIRMSLQESKSEVFFYAEGMNTLDAIVKTAPTQEAACVDS